MRRSSTGLSEIYGDLLHAPRAFGEAGH